MHIRSLHKYVYLHEKHSLKNKLRLQIDKTTINTWKIEHIVVVEKLTTVPISCYNFQYFISFVSIKVIWEAGYWHLDLKNGNSSRNFPFFTRLLNASLRLRKQHLTNNLYFVPLIQRKQINYILSDKRDRLYFNSLNIPWWINNNF